MSLYTPKEFAAKLRISERKLRDMKATGEIDFVPFGRLTRYSDAILEEYEQKNRTNATRQNEAATGATATA